MTVTVAADKDMLALYRMLTDPGRWLVFVHQGHIVKLTKLPPEQPVDEILSAEDKALTPQSTLVQSDQEE